MTTMLLREPKTSRVRSLAGGVLLLGAVMAIIAHVVGAWIFSGWIRDQALVPPVVDRVADGAVLDVTGDRVTIRAFDTADDDLAAPGVTGFDYGDGFLRLGEVVGRSGDDVTRTFQLVEGSAPALGASGTIESSPTAVDVLQRELGVVETGYEGPLGGMDAWIIEGSSTWVIHVHDRHHTMDQALRAMSILAPEGATQLAISYRNDPGQPQDPSGLAGYGVTERDDLAAALEFARSEGASTLVLMGYGSGASIVLAETYRSRDIAAVVLDGPILDARSAVHHQADSAEGLAGAMPSTIRAVGLVAASLRFGISWDTTDYLERADLLGEPTLVIHGTLNPIAPIEDSRALAAERSEVVTLLEVEGAGADRTWNVDPDAYQNALLGFLDRVRAAG